VGLHRLHIATSERHEHAGPSASVTSYPKSSTLISPAITDCTIDVGRTRKGL